MGVIGICIVGIILVKGNYVDAGLTLTGAIPLAGDAAKAGKYGRKIKPINNAIPKKSKAEVLAENVVKGKLAEIKVLNDLRKQGKNVRPNEEYLYTPFGRRKPDIAVLDSNGNVIYYVEVKSGSSPYTIDQWVKDIYIGIKEQRKTQVIRTD